MYKPKTKSSFKKYSWGLLFLFVVFLNSSQIKTNNTGISTAQEGHPIIISSDNGFVGYPGSGTKEDPFRIENKTIFSRTANGIYIKGTSKHFIIKNCKINAGNDRSGIYLSFIEKNTGCVYNSTISQTGIGINVYYSEGVRICNNTIFGCDNTAIVTRSSSNCLIDSNRIRNNGQHGALFDVSNNITAQNNYIYDNSLFGMYSIYSHSLKYRNNRIFEDGIFFFEQDIENYLTYEISNNSVNDKELGFYCNIKNMELTKDFGQLLLINCSGIIVTNVSQSRSDYGTYMYNCSDCLIKNSYFAENEISAILLSKCSGNTIMRNFFIRNSQTGIKIIKSEFVYIMNNTLYRNYQGITLEASKECTISDNRIERNINYGIILGEGTENNQVFDNEFIENNFLGNSQAYDAGTKNRWFNTDTARGNFWDDYEKEGVYRIDGPARSYDKYPYGREDINPTENTTFFAFVTLITVLTLGAFLLKRSYNKS